ncbi:MAG TPA: SseB family protein [Rhodoglobus sp.]|nr:SseB family protein [Rhodoglobus sp.]
MSDSAGVPWEGRSFHANPGAGDDGSADPRLTEAIARFRARELGIAGVIPAVRAARLLVPLIAVRGDEGVGAHGQLVDKTQELSIVTVAGPDGRAVLPAFSSVTAMQRWDARARPIPIEAPRVALAAAAEGTPLIVLDPGSEQMLGIRRPALRALATGEAWTPAFEDEAVLQAFLATAADLPVRAIQLAPGDPDARLAAPEVLVQLAIEGDPAPTVRTLGERWASDPLIAERVDSIAVRVERV